MSIIIIDEFTGRLMHRPAVVRRPAPGRRGQARPRRRPDQGRNADAGHDHPAELLQAVQEAGGHDRHGHDRGQRVLEDLQARRGRHPDQQAADPHQQPRRHLPHGTRRSGKRSSTEIVEVTQGRPADPGRHDRRGQIAEAEPSCSSAAASSTNCSTPCRSMRPARPRSWPRRAASAPSPSPPTWPAAAPTSSSAATPRPWPGPSSRTSTPRASTCPRRSGRRPSTRSRPRRR